MLGLKKGEKIGFRGDIMVEITGDVCDGKVGF